MQLPQSQPLKLLRLHEGGTEIPGGLCFTHGRSCEASFSRIWTKNESGFVFRLLLHLKLRVGEQCYASPLHSRTSSSYSIQVPAILPQMTSILTADDKSPGLRINTLVSWNTWLPAEILGHGGVQLNHLRPCPRREWPGQPKVWGNHSQYLHDFSNIEP